MMASCYHFGNVIVILVTIQQKTQQISIFEQKMEQLSVKLRGRRCTIYSTEALKIFFAISTMLTFQYEVISLFQDIMLQLVALKNCTPFTKFFVKTEGTAIGNAEDLDMVMEFELF